jgi:hypothetical protein
MMRPRARTLLAAAAWVAAIGLAAMSFVLLALGSSAFVSPASVDPPPWWLEAAVLLAYLPLPTVGALVTSRRPGNPIGPILLVAGLLVFAYFSSESYALLAGRRADLPGRVIAGWLATWIEQPNVVLVLTFLPLLFPDGRFLSRRWRVVGWVAGVLAACQLVAQALGRPALVTSDPNPLFVALVAPVQVLLNGLLGAPLALAFLATSGSAVVVRFQRARRIERIQLKWFLYAVGVALIVFVIVLPLVLIGALPDNIAAPMTYLAFALPPLAVGIAILRHHLYDIDVLINRTIVYAATSATIAGAFFGGIVVLQALLRPFTGGSEIAVAGATLASFALLQPLRRRIQQTVERRFSRARYDAQRTLDDFAVQLRDEVELESVRAQLISAVAQTMSPAHASLWLRKRTQGPPVSS